MPKPTSPADVHILQRQRRRKARVSQAEIACVLHCSRQVISLYELGERELPWDMTAADYDRALVAAMEQRS